MKRAALSDWVTNLRMVTMDEVSQRVAIEKVYAMTSGGSSAQTTVTEFYRSAPPATRAQTETVHASISSLLPTSDKTWEVEWTDVTRDLRGNTVREQRWKGVFTFVLRSGPSTDEKLSRLNPIGLFVTHANWTPIV
jgi:type IV secretion system protein TrbF